MEEKNALALTFHTVTLTKISVYYTAKIAPVSGRDIIGSDILSSVLNRGKRKENSS